MFLEKLENVLQNLRVVKSMQGYTPATLHCRSPGCEQRWHIQSFWLGFHVANVVADAGYCSNTITTIFCYPSHVLRTNIIYYTRCRHGNKKGSLNFFCVCWATTLYSFILSLTISVPFNSGYRVLMTVFTVRLVRTKFNALKGFHLKLFTSYCTHFSFSNTQPPLLQLNKYIPLNLKVNVYRYIFI